MYRALSTQELKNDEYRDSPTSLGNLLQCLTALTVKNFFPTSSRKLPCLNLCSYQEPSHKGSDSAFLTTSPEVLEGYYQFPQYIFFSSLDKPNYLSLCSYHKRFSPNHLGSSPLDLLNFINLCSSTKLDTIFCICPKSIKNRGIITSSDLLAIPLLIQLSLLLAFINANAHCLSPACYPPEPPASFQQIKFQPFHLPPFPLPRANPSQVHDLSYLC